MHTDKRRHSLRSFWIKRTALTARFLTAMLLEVIPVVCMHTNLLSTIFWAFLLASFCFLTGIDLRPWEQKKALTTFIFFQSLPTWQDSTLQNRNHLAVCTLHGAISSPWWRAVCLWFFPSPTIWKPSQVLTNVVQLYTCNWPCVLRSSKPHLSSLHCKQGLWHHSVPCCW